METKQFTFNKVFTPLVFIFFTICSFGQTVTNGSIGGTPAGNSNFSMVAGWNNCVLAIGNTPDVCDVGFPSYSGNTMMLPAPSPDGGTWAGLANGVNPIEQECIEGTMTGLTVGTPYALQFYGSCFGVSPSSTAYANSSPAAGVVTIGGVVLDTVYAIMQDSVWNTYCVAFTATSATMTFTIQSTFGGGYLNLDGFTVISPVSNVGSIVDTSICAGTSHVLDATTLGATYTWHDNSTNPTFTATQSGTYWVDVLTGCTSHTDTFNVTYSPAPVLNLGNDTTLCPGQNLLLDATSAGATYLWQDNSTNPTFTATQADTFWVESTLGGCTLTDSIIISYNSIPGISLGNDTTLCAGDSLVLDPMISNATYLWQDNSTDSTLTLFQAGTYWVEVTTACAVGIDTIIVSYNPNPVINLGNDTTLCEGQQLLLDVTLPNTTYLWQDNSTNPTFNVSQNGTYWVEATENGCSSNDTILVNYTPLPIVNLGNDTSLCFNDQHVLSAAIPGATYLWQDNSTNSTFTVSQTGNYSVTVTNNNCSAQDDIDIVVYDQINVSITADTVGCEFQPLNFQDLTISAAGTIQNWNWTFGDNGVLNSRSGTHTYVSSGNYQANLTVTTSFGCSNDTTFNVKIYPQPVAGFTFTPEDPKLEEVVIFNDESEKALTWNWVFGDGNYDNLPNTSHVYNFPYTYTVMQIVSNNGCVDTAFASVPLLEEQLFYIPNAFTPDGNGFNATFTPIFISGFDPYNFHMAILNRWGEVIFETYDASIGWDGTYGANGLVQNGTYIWRVEFGDINSDKTFNYEGHVTLIR